MISRAFVLGAGLGTRLRPLTTSLPKPLIPVWHQPLITRAFAHLRSVGVEQFIVNTHWQPEAYETAFPDAQWQGSPITFRHEPILLETAGGIANVADLLAGESFWVYNGDILSDLPLAAAVARHQQSDDLCTLILRRDGAEKVVAFDDASGQVRDIRNLLGTGLPPTHQFTGLYLCRPEFLQLLEPGKKESSRTIFLQIIQQSGRVGGVVVEDGVWMDLGDRASYLAAHAALPAVAHQSPIPEGVTVRGTCAIGRDVTLGPGAVLTDTVVWDGGAVAAGADLTRCIIRSGSVGTGTATDHDF
jgi:mannose-1-phosphate guanylyltransferase